MPLPARSRLLGHPGRLIRPQLLEPGVCALARFRGHLAVRPQFDVTSPHEANPSDELGIPLEASTEMAQMPPGPMKPPSTGSDSINPQRTIDGQRFRPHRSPSRRSMSEDSDSNKIPESQALPKQDAPHTGNPHMKPHGRGRSSSQPLLEARDGKTTLTMRHRGDGTADEPTRRARWKGNAHRCRGAGPRWSCPRTPDVSRAGWPR